MVVENYDSQFLRPHLSKEDSHCSKNHARIKWSWRDNKALRLDINRKASGYEPNKNSQKLLLPLKEVLHKGLTEQ